MDESTLLNLVIAVGTIGLVFFGVISWRSGRQKRRLVRSRDLHREYLKLSKIIEAIREPNYLKTDFHDLAVAVSPGSIHIRERELRTLTNIIRRDNPQIEIHTCDAWNQVFISRRRMTYPSSTIVFEVNQVAFDSFEEDVKRTLDTMAKILRENAPDLEK